MVYDQCSQQVQDKLKATKDWETVEKEQSLHELIRRIERICVGFDDRRQLMYNLVQSLKTLFLYTQLEKDSIDNYARNFRSLWNMVEAFGATPGIHEGLVGAELYRLGINAATATADQLGAAEAVSAKQVKAALLISGADRRKYGKLKDELASSYLLGSDQYPNTLEKAARILSNYQVTRVNVPYRGSPNDEGVAFLQQGGRGGRGAGRGGRGGQGAKSNSTGGGSAGADNVSTITGRTGGTIKTNSKGKSHCFNCGSTSHWADECSQLSEEQQSQLHMALKAQDDKKEQAEEGPQLLHVALAQGGALPDNRAYLDGCSTVTAFKSRKYLENIRTVERSVRINCNVGAMVTNKRGAYGGLKV